MRDSILKLNLQDKESIVRLLQDVQNGYISCRRGATEIMNRLPKKHLVKHQREHVREMRKRGESVEFIARAYNINASTVWRICKEDQP